MAYTVLYILNLTFYPLLISCQNTGERLHSFQRECWFEIASSCFGEFPGCFEVCTPLSVLTLTQRAMAAAIYTSCGRIGFPHVTDFFFFFYSFFFWGYPRNSAMPQKWAEELLWQSKKDAQNRLVFADHTRCCFMLLFFAAVEDCSCDFHIAKYQGHSQRVQTNASLTILTVYWFSLWNLCCFSAGPPTVALTASPTGGSRWHKSVGPDAEWSPPMHLRFQKPHPSPDLIEIPHTRPESPASPTLLLAVFF